jgi:hypothetical protein
MNAALARRKAAHEAVDRERAAKQSPKEQFREQEAEDYDLNNIDSPLFTARPERVCPRWLSKKGLPQLTL